MSTLEDRLRSGLTDLAGDLPRSRGGPPAEELWTAGRRRARVAGASVLVTCSLVCAVLAGAWLQARPDLPEPAGTADRVGIPSRFHVPSPWLRGTGDEPSGRLVALIPAGRGSWWGSRPGLVGVAAATGEYRFLDLPDLADPEQAAISPDGRHVGYWTTGTPSGTPGRDLDSDLDPTVTGYAVYDTETGQVRRHQVDTTYGLETSAFFGSLLWVDDGHLVLGYGQVQGPPGGLQGSSSSGFETWVWSIGAAAEPRRLPSVDPTSVVGTTGAGELVVAGPIPEGRGERYDLVALDETRRTGPTPGQVMTGPVFDPTGSRFALVPGEMDPGPLRVADRGDGRDLLPARVPGVSEIVGWRADGRVVVEQVSYETSRAQFSVIDPSTAEATRLARLDLSQLRGVRLAPGLLDAPVVDAPAPPTPWDPRAVAGALGAIVLLAGLVLWAWRRRPVVLLE